jgi:polyketide cyclase/dehydrase/lipid transport protein
LALFRFDRTWDFPVEPSELWAKLSRTEDFHRWWPWLRALQGGELVPGSRAEAVVRAPLPYTLRFSVDVLEVVPEQLVAARVSGDLEGPARLEVAPRPEGSSARLVWEMDVRRPLLRAAARVGRPALEWGHDWVVASGIEQFRRALDGVGDSHDDDRA